jgi:TorA maturation chaperone TorD
MLGKRPKKDGVKMAAIASGRAELYHLLVGIFGHLPDKNLVTKIKSGGFRDVLDSCYGLDDLQCRSGAEYIHSYQSRAQNRPDEEILTELSVDRTRILRETGQTGLKPPYEGLYKNDKNIGASLLQVKTFYRKAGLLPEDSVHESPDYLGVELDFMKNLCLREQTQWASNGDASETVAHEENFLTEHLGSWVGEYCAEAGKWAQTDFYRGFLAILDTVVSMDMAYLNKLERAPKD